MVGGREGRREVAPRRALFVTVTVRRYAEEEEEREEEEATCAVHVRGSALCAGESEEDRCLADTISDGEKLG